MTDTPRQEEDEKSPKKISFVSECVRDSQDSQPANVAPEDLPPGSPVRIAAWLRNNPFPEEFRRTREEILRDLEEERNAWD